MDLPDKFLSTTQHPPPQVPQVTDRGRPMEITMEIFFILIQSPMFRVRVLRLSLFPTVLPGVLIRHKFGASSEGVDNERDPHDWLTISESTVLAEMTPIQRTQKTSDSARTELWLSVRR